MSALIDTRPRDLRWYHAGPMLFGDLGTSRLYVLGLAFYFTRHASLFHIFFVNILLVLVGSCYLIICRKFPEGGGVYSSAKSASRVLALVGGLMLCADYTVTAAMSCLDAFRYLGVSGNFLGLRVELYCTLGAIGLIGAVNWFGPKGMGLAALCIAVATVILTIIIASCAIPFLHHTRIEFPISERYSLSAYGDAWVGFTEIVLALSGIEAIANMTGIMVPPVRSTSKRSIIPVLGEVVILNLLLGAAMNALPDAKLIDPQGNPLGTDNMMNILAESYVGPTFAMLSAFIFGALLLSAVNTAVTDLVATQYMMAKDGEVPNILAKLNRHGVPGLALLVAMAIPALLLVLFPDLTQLAGLYSVGVVAAITINLLSTAFTRQFDLIGWERWLLGSVGILMAGILVTLLWNKPNARAFSMAVLNIGLSARILTQVGRAQLTPQWRLGFRIFAIASLLGQLAITVFVPAELIWPFVVSAIVAATLIVAGKYLFNTIPNQDVPAQPENLDGDYEPNDTYLVAASHPTFQFDSVMTEARNNKAGVTVLFVKELALPQMGSNSLHLPAEDALAKDIFSHAENPARRLGVPLTLVYLAGGSVSERIVSIARDCKATRLYMQLSKRTAVQRFFKGDVIGPVAEKIPPEMELIIRG